MLPAMICASSQLVVQLAACGIESIANGYEWILMSVIVTARTVHVDLAVLEANPYANVVERALLVVLVRRLDSHMTGCDVIAKMVEATGQGSHALFQGYRRCHASKCDLK
jgi:hypothetical protein